MFAQKFQKALAINWAFDNVVCNNSIKSDSGKNGKSGAMDKAFPDKAMNSFR